MSPRALDLASVPKFAAVWHKNIAIYAGIPCENLHLLSIRIKRGHNVGLPYE